MCLVMGMAIGGPEDLCCETMKEYLDADRTICCFQINEYYLKYDFKYQKGAKNKEEGTDGKGGGNQLPREGGDPIQGHLTSAFLEAKHRSKQTQPLPLPRSVSTNQLGAATSEASGD